MNCRFVTTNGQGKIRCSFWVDVGFGWAFICFNITVSSNLSSVVVWVNLFSSRLRLLKGYCRLLSIIFTGSFALYQILSGMKEQLIFKYTMLWIKCERSKVFASWRIWKFSIIDRTHRSNWFLVYDKMRIWIWRDSESCLNTERKPKENGISGRKIERTRRKKVSRGRWLRLYLVTKDCRDRTWSWSCAKGRRCERLFFENRLLVYCLLENLKIPSPETHQQRLPILSSRIICHTSMKVFQK